MSQKPPAIVFEKMYDPPAWKVHLPGAEWPFLCRAARVSSEADFQQLVGLLIAETDGKEDAPNLFGVTLGTTLWAIAFGAFVPENQAVWQDVDRLLSASERDWITAEDLDWLLRTYPGFLSDQEQLQPN